MMLRPAPVRVVKQFVHMAFLAQNISSGTGKEVIQEPGCNGMDSQSDTYISQFTYTQTLLGC